MDRQNTIDQYSTELDPRQALRLARQALRLASQLQLTMEEHDLQMQGGAMVMLMANWLAQHPPEVREQVLRVHFHHVAMMTDEIDTGALPDG